MDLQQRLGSTRSGTGATTDGFDEVKNRIHLAVIGELGPQLFAADADPEAVRDRVAVDIRGRLQQETGIAREDRERCHSEQEAEDH